MLSFVIGDHDMVTGFRLVGASGIEVTSAEAAHEAFSKALEQKDVAILLISDEFASQIRSEIDRARSEQNIPVIVEVPGSVGASAHTRLSDLVSKVLGMRI